MWPTTTVRHSERLADPGQRCDARNSRARQRTDRAAAASCQPHRPHHASHTGGTTPATQAAPCQPVDRRRAAEARWRRADVGERSTRARVFDSTRGARCTTRSPIIGPASWPAPAQGAVPGSPGRIALFSGSLYELALTGVRGPGAITPPGGIAFLVGMAKLRRGRASIGAEDITAR